MSSTTVLEPVPRSSSPSLGLRATSASSVVQELFDMVVRAPDLDLHRDPVLVDRLETLALEVWDAVHLDLGLPRWTGVAPPSNRWVVLERSVGRLHQRLDDPRLRALPVGESTQVALCSARSSWEAASGERRADQASSSPRMQLTA